MISLGEAIFLSIIQGITEWFPVSSSGHLALAQNFFGFQSLPYDVFLHLASVCAIIIYFWKDVLSFFSLSKEKIVYIIKIICAMIPAAIVGIMFRDFFELLMENMIVLGIGFMFSGFIIYLTKFIQVQKSEVGFFDAFIIGIAQSLALFPSVSRSGMTISSGLLRNIDRGEAARFSFLLAIPALIGANLFELKNIASLNVSYIILIISFITTFVVSLFTIQFLIKVIKSDKFYLFSWYNIILGILVVAWSLLF